MIVYDVGNSERGSKLPLYFFSPFPPHSKQAILGFFPSWSSSSPSTQPSCLMTWLKPSTTVRAAAASPKPPSRTAHRRRVQPLTHPSPRRALCSACARPAAVADMAEAIEQELMRDPEMSTMSGEVKEVCATNVLPRRCAEKASLRASACMPLTCAVHPFFFQLVRACECRVSTAGRQR